MTVGVATWLVRQGGYFLPPTRLRSEKGWGQTMLCCVVNTLGCGGKVIITFLAILIALGWCSFVSAGFPAQDGWMFLVIIAGFLLLAGLGVVLCLLLGFSLGLILGLLLDLASLLCFGVPEVKWALMSD